MPSLLAAAAVVPRAVFSSTLTASLQGIFGNRAVQRLVAANSTVTEMTAAITVPPVQRVTETSAPPAVQRVFGRNMRKRIKANDYPNLMPLVEKARAKKATREELEDGLRKVEKYSKAAAKMKDVDVPDRLSKLGAIGDSLQLALDYLNVAASKEQAMAKYLEEGRGGGLKALSKSSEALYSGEGMPLAAKDRGMHKAEAAAFGAFTRNDFRYINPAAAHNKKWLKSQAEAGGVGGSEKQQLEEGALHAGMMMAGMQKLDRFEGEGYRGERLTPEQFAEQYTEEDGVVTAKKPTQVKASFWSVSLDRGVAETFAKDSSNRDATVSILYIIALTDARDLREISASAQEDEVLCPAGSKLTVTGIKKLTKGEAGTPAATAWYQVSMTQTSGSERRLE